MRKILIRTKGALLKRKPMADAAPSLLKLPHAQKKNLIDEFRLASRDSEDILCNLQLKSALDIRRATLQNLSSLQGSIYNRRQSSHNLERARLGAGTTPGMLQA